MDETNLAEIIERVGIRWQDPDYQPRRRAMEATLEADNRFTAEAIIFAINQQARQLRADALLAWTGSDSVQQPVPVVVINPGNVPFAELQDFLAVTLTGHTYTGKMSARSPYLLQAFVDDLIEHGARVNVELSTTLQPLMSDNALIASGSDPTISTLSRMAEEAGIPPRRILVRGHRFSAAVLGGNEVAGVLERLAEDILLHEGLGCRNVAVVWAPRDAAPDALLDAMARFRAVFPAHPDTAGGLKMQIAYYRAADLAHAYADDSSFLISRGGPEAQRPGHVRWTEYDSLANVRRWLTETRERIQVVAVSPRVELGLDTVEVPAVALGDTQRPPLGWKQGQTDVVSFLRSL
ncbi:MAG: hypothetical protein HKN37_03460 [Rhodothermales bacterium]|nr:hypothetical protein [Rhodothermales bacterium]